MMMMMMLHILICVHTVGVGNCRGDLTVCLSNENGETAQKLLSIEHDGKGNFSMLFFFCILFFLLSTFLNLF